MIFSSYPRKSVLFSCFYPRKSVFAAEYLFVTGDFRSWSLFLMPPSLPPKSLYVGIANLSK